MFKKILISLIIFVTTACSSSFMNDAKVADINGRTIVMFDAGTRNGVKYYRPQFASDCQYEKIYEDDDTSTGCLIRESRLTNIHSYNHHKKSGKIVKPSIRNEVVQETIEGTNSSIHIPDNI